MGGRVAFRILRCVRRELTASFQLFLAFLEPSLSIFVRKESVGCPSAAASTPAEVPPREHCMRTEPRLDVDFPSEGIKAS